jgi:dienelactone hydrolase
MGIDLDRIGLIGHSLGGLTVLLATAVQPRVRAVVAHAPAGSTNQRPGVIYHPPDLEWDRDVPTLLLAGQSDVPVPPGDVRDIFDRMRATERMVVLARADHQHFLDDVEGSHEMARS